MDNRQRFHVNFKGSLSVVCSTEVGRNFVVGTDLFCFLGGGGVCFLGLEVI